MAYRPAALAFASLLAASATFAQTPDAILDAKNGDGTTRLRVNVDGGFLVGGEYDGGYDGSGIPTEWAGTRLMWYPGKAAFRAGVINGTQWDAANIGSASVAIGENVRASGDYGTAFGIGTTAANRASFAVGEGNMASGAASVALGYGAHTNARQGSFVFADRTVAPDPLVFDSYVRASNNHSATWRVSCGFRIFTSSNLSTGVAFGGASVTDIPAATCPSQQFGLSNTMIATSTGAYLSTSGVWTNTSDVNRKRDFVPVAGEDVLARLRRLPISTWAYKVDPAGVRHLGPTAQDFKAAFGLGNDDKTIGTVDADGVALAAAQALDARTTRQQDEIDALEAQNAALVAQNEALRVRLEALESRAGATPLQAVLPVIAGLVGLCGLVALSRRGD